MPRCWPTQTRLAQKSVKKKRAGKPSKPSEVRSWKVMWHGKQGRHIFLFEYFCVARTCWVRSAVAAAFLLAQTYLIWWKCSDASAAQRRGKEAGAHLGPVPEFIGRCTVALRCCRSRLAKRTLMNCRALYISIDGGGRPDRARRRKSPFQCQVCDLRCWLLGVDW
jgi:hypothetical protein